MFCWFYFACFNFPTLWLVWVLCLWQEDLGFAGDSILRDQNCVKFHKIDFYTTPFSVKHKQLTKNFRRNWIISHQTHFLQHRNCSEIGQVLRTEYPLLANGLFITDYQPALVAAEYLWNLEQTAKLEAKFCANILEVGENRSRGKKDIFYGRYFILKFM